MIGIRVFLFAILIDLLIGDPVWLPHPVVLMGKGIQRLEKNIGSCQVKMKKIKNLWLCAGLLDAHCDDCSFRHCIFCLAIIAKKGQ